MFNENLRNFDKRQVLALKEAIKEFKIPYRSTLGLPDNISFGCEIEFLMPNYNNEYKRKLYKEGYYNTILEYMLSIGDQKYGNIKMNILIKLR